jgi:hypothetical protein
MSVWWYGGGGAWFVCEGVKIVRTTTNLSTLFKHKKSHDHDREARGNVCQVGKEEHVVRVDVDFGVSDTAIEALC